MRAIVIILGLITFSLSYLLITDTRILIQETKVAPGQEFHVDDYGDLGKSSQASLVCEYFNGRKVLKKVFWYSSNNIMGKDSCPFINEI